MVIQTWEFGIHFLKKWNEPVTSRKTWQYSLPMIKSEVSSKAWDLGKLVSTAMNLIAFQYINTLLMRLEMILTNVIFDVA